MKKIVLFLALFFGILHAGCKNEYNSKTIVEQDLPISKINKQSQAIPEIEGEYYCGDESSSKRVVITKNGTDAYTFYVEFHSDKDTDYGGHLFEYEDTFERVFQSNDSTICEFSLSKECILKLTIQSNKCSIELSDPYYIYPVQLNECTLNKVR